MKLLLAPILWLLSLSVIAAQDTHAEEGGFLRLLHTLQYGESVAQMQKLIPNCPAPTPDAGDGNTEIIVKRKLFGFEARGEFNFHQGILVSHGFEILTRNYPDAHRTFLQAVSILDSQVNGLKLTATLPTALDEGESSDGPADEITLTVSGTQNKASYQLRLDLREKTTVVRWGAQKTSKR